jgi:hypothetical protein
MVIFFATTHEIFSYLVQLAGKLAEDGISSEWKPASYHGEDILSLEVSAHGNVVAPYLRRVWPAN